MNRHGFGAATLRAMWARVGWLTVVEIAGFAALVAGTAAFGWLFAGPLGAGASGLVAVGCSAVYLANAYAFAPGEESDDAER